MKRLEKLKQQSREASKNKVYIDSLKKPVWEHAFLLEGGQGKNLNGNAFAMLRCIRNRPEYDDWDVYFTVMPDMMEAAEKRLAKYGLRNVSLLINGSDEYKTALARAKYLVTDNSFSIYFVKREEQVYLNTWHGTPFKALGRTDLRNNTSLANVQSNMLKADYLLHPNHFTRDIMMRDYMAERLYSGKTVVLDYPRNDALYKEEYCGEIREKYGLAGKHLIAYMPTWRGTGRDAEIESQIEETKEIISGISSALGDDEVLCVNLHFLLGSNIDISGLDNVMMFPREYETYDFLAVCDALITDYSSVSADFAGTGREILLYIYDYEKYRAEKGFYLDVKDLPFRQAGDMEELKEQLSDIRAKQSYRNAGYAMSRALTCENKGDSANQVLDLMVKGNEEGLEIQDYGKPNDTNLVYFEKLYWPENRGLLDLYISRLTDEQKQRTVIAFENVINEETLDVLENLDPAIDFIRVKRTYYKGSLDYISTALFKKKGLMRRAANAYYEREARRILEFMNIESLELILSQSVDRSFILSKAPARTIFYKYPARCYRRNRGLFEKRPELYNELAGSFDEIRSFTDEEINEIWSRKE